jgi:hypothetical protein
MNKILRILGILFLLFSGNQVFADQTYTIDLTNWYGLDSLTGTVVTNGGVGYLTQSQLVNWDLTASAGGISEDFSSSVAGSTFTNAVGGFYFGPTSLSFDGGTSYLLLASYVFNDALYGGGIGFTNTVATSGGIIPILTFNGTKSANSLINGEGSFITPSVDVTGQTFNVTTSVTNSAVVPPVPEPKEWVMLLLGLAALTLVAKRGSAGRKTITA